MKPSSSNASTASWGKKSAGANSPLVMKSPRSPSVDQSSEGPGGVEEAEQVGLDAFAAAVEHLARASSVLASSAGSGSCEDLARGLSELPVLESDLAHKGLLVQAGSMLLKAENMRASVLSQLNSDVSIPMKQFLRVDVAGIHEMQDRVEVAKSALDEAQLRYDIARSSNKKKAVVEKLSVELENCKRTHSLLRMNLASKLKEFEARQRLDCMQRLLKFMGNYGAMFLTLQNEFSQISEKINGAVQQLEQRKGAWDLERSQVDVSEIIAAEMMEMEISRQGYVDMAQGTVGSTLGRPKKLWMVASQGFMHWYQTWKDEAPKQTVDLVVCSVKSLPDEPESFMMTSPSEQFSIKCQTADEAEAWMEVIRKSIQYKLKKLQEEKRRNDPTAAPDYLREMQMLSPENKLCADCGNRTPEWASISLGVLICDNCSGIHRSLGTHISRVRSLTIDMWIPEQYYLLKQYGNSFANPIWEHNFANDKINKRLGGKPTAASTREERELFVRSKYVDKKWLLPPPDAWKRPGSKSTDPLTPQELAEKLYDFGSKNDLKGLYLALAHGANPSTVLESGLSVFHQLISDGFADVYSLQKLMLHSLANNDLSKKSQTGFDALHYAAHHNRALACKLLLSQGFDANNKTSSGLTAKDLAIAANAKSVITFFETGQVPTMKEEQLQHDQLQKQAQALLSRISKKLDSFREQLAASESELEDKEELVFELAKQIRMVKIGIQQMEKDKLM